MIICENRFHVFYYMIREAIFQRLEPLKLKAAPARMLNHEKSRTIYGKKDITGGEFPN